MSADFRQLALKGEQGKAERLFRAAISAYCSLVRPARRDAAQLDDLTLPLYPSIPPVARRFAAAALSECHPAPQALVRLLSGEPAEISAPLLVRSSAIGDIDLIALIGRHGLPHARAIARRPDLNPVIGDLLDALKDAEIRRLRTGLPRAALHAVPPRPAAPKIAAAAVNTAGEAAAENARRQLRAMMLPAVEQASVFQRLCEAALSGHLPLFHAAMADALKIDLEAARELTGYSSLRDLCASFRQIGLNEEQAFLLASALFPAVSSSVEAIRLFLERYRLVNGQPTAAPAVSTPTPLRMAIRQVS